MSTDTLTTPPPTSPPESVAPAPVEPPEAVLDDERARADRALIEKEVDQFIGLNGPVPAEPPLTGESSPPVEPVTIPPSLAYRLLTLPIRLVVMILVILDLPFGFMGRTVKTLIGFVAVGTAVMAAAVWVFGPRMAAALPAEPAGSDRPAVHAESAGAAAGAPDGHPAKTSSSSSHH